ncbi:MAG: ABC transporter ATP-binding protein [Alphaproteobacteria bacterium]|nr:ABC transporter ATP-binding protein [Alphaproteobacteria bacterium]
MIKATDLTKTYQMGPNEIRALINVSLSIEAGEYVAIIGPSGSGKSTLMNVLGGLDRPDSGRYFFDGEDVLAMNDDALAAFRGSKIGFVFQSFQLLPRLSARLNIELPLVYAGMVPGERRRRAEAMLVKVGLGQRGDSRPSQLSGGQQQRVAIARALASEPRLMLCDEPTGALDQKTGREILDLLEALNRQGSTVLMVTHDLQIASRARRIIEMRDGAVIRDGAPQ